MTNPIHPLPLRPPVSLWKRVTAALGRDSFNTWACAALFHFLTLTDAERDMIIRNYAAMKAGVK